MDADEKLRKCDRGKFDVAVKQLQPREHIRDRLASKQLGDEVRIQIPSLEVHRPGEVTSLGDRQIIDAHDPLRRVHKRETDVWPLHGSCEYVANLGLQRPSVHSPRRGT